MRVEVIDDPRRRVLIEALALGLFSGVWPAGSAFAQSVFGSRPVKLPPGQSIYRLSGTASINGTPATLRSSIRIGDMVETGKDSELIFVLGEQAMILRSESRITIQGGAGTSSLLISALRLLSGKVLSVSRESRARIETPTATIGIRGTGWYAEADPEQTYFCTCYGLVDVSATNDPQSRDTVAATHHDRPLYILAKSAPGQSIRRAPFINHTDQELALIETLVGRTPPFVFPKDDYSGPRRDY